MAREVLGEEFALLAGHVLSNAYILAIASILKGILLPACLSTVFGHEEKVARSVEKILRACLNFSIQFQFGSGSEESEGSLFDGSDETEKDEEDDDEEEEEEEGSTDDDEEEEEEEESDEPVRFVVQYQGRMRGGNILSRVGEGVFMWGNGQVLIVTITFMLVEAVRPFLTKG